MPEIASNLGNISSFIAELVDVNAGIHNAQCGRLAKVVRLDGAN
ncbi:MAG TPA: hypothetical protein VKA40_08250 [Nitrososphaera sp.]|jgi:hypothetical protein|nr:hypothetical protein [Nitrososphaera sp.]